MHFAALPDVRASQSPAAPCVADDSTGRVTNAHFLDLVRIYADRLSVAGVGAGDVVAVMLPNRLELIVALFAAWRLGAAATPINPSLTPTEVGYQLADSDARVLICNDGHSQDTSVPVLLTLSDLDRHATMAAAVTEADFSAESLALLVYTSGTTGRPKGVELTHANISAMAETMVTSSHLTAQDHSLLILPLFHVNGIVVSVLSPLLAGGQATVAGRFDPATFFDRVAAARPTYFSAVPAIYAMLSARPDDDVVPDTSSVRFAACGAAPMPVELLTRFEQRYRITIYEGYGLSEGTCASASNPLGGVRKPGTVGPALPGQQIAIVDGNGEFVTDGTPGEVVIKGPTVMRGYLGRPEETARTVIDGWLHTGDVGRLDEDGYLTLVDRKKDMIIRGGENIYPKEIESAIYAHPQVLEAAVVGRPHPVYGEVPVAFVSYRDGAELAPEDMLEYLRTSLAKFKLPAEIINLGEVPKNPVGKIDKPGLRNRLAETV